MPENGKLTEGEIRVLFQVMDERVTKKIIENNKYVNDQLKGLSNLISENVNFTAKNINDFSKVIRKNNEFFLKQINMVSKNIIEHVEEVRDELRAEQKTEIESKVNEKLLEKIGVKWQAGIFIVSAIALFLALFTYLGALNSGSLERSLQGEIKRLEQVMTHKIEAMNRLLEEKEQKPRKLKH